MLNRKIFLSALIAAGIFLCGNFSVNAQINLSTAEDYFNHAKALEDAGQFYDGVKACTKAIEIRTDYYDAWFLRGKLWFALHYENKSIQDFTKAIELCPRCPEPYLARTHIYDILKKYDDEIRDYSRLIAMYPSEASYYAGRAGIYSHEFFKYRTALIDYNRAITLKPVGDYYFERGNILFAIGKNESAIKDFSRAIELEPKNAMYYQFRALVYKKMGKKEQADNDLQSAEGIFKSRQY